MARGRFRGAFFLLCLFEGLLFWILVPSSFSAAGNIKPVRFAFPALSAVYLPIWVAKEAGIFQKSGLDVAVNYVASNNRLTAAMIGGSIEIGVGGSASIDANARKASDLVFVAAIAQRAVASLYARPEVKSIADLKGKIIATVGKATLTDDAARIILLQNRIPLDEVKFVYTNSVSADLTALVSGNVAAAILTAPGTLFARKAGMIEIANAAAMDYPYLHGSIVVLRPYLKSDRETLKLFLRSLVDGIHESKENASRAVEIMAKYLKGSRETLLESYKTFVPFFPDYPEVPLQAIENVASLHGLSLDGGAVERMIDNSVIREVVNGAGKNMSNAPQVR